MEQPKHEASVAAAPATSDDPFLLTKPDSGVTIRASSVLQRNMKLYSPYHMFDLANTTSSWNSEGCSTDTDTDTQEQSLLITFPKPIAMKCMKIQFQAGFSVELCKVYAYSTVDKKESIRLVDELDIEDVHDLQSFDIDAAAAAPATTKVKLVFDEYTDFYGRIIIYQLQIYGSSCCCQ